MSESNDSHSAIDFFGRRLGTKVHLGCADAAALVSFFRQCGVEDAVDAAERVSHTAASSGDGGAFQLASSAVVHQNIATSQGKATLVCVLDGPCALASQTVRCACEAWELNQQLAESRLTLEDSAMQLAQSFEEQNWLRGFAQNATSFSKVQSANEIADGILQPLGFLLRAEDVFLLVSSEETERSGLVSAKYGTSNISLVTASSICEAFGIASDTKPLVRNNITLSTDDGDIHSLAAVAIADAEVQRGILLAVNRSATTIDGALPVYDTEFGSNDVGLLREAAVLLNTQAQNMHLLVQSNHLFLGTLHAMSSAIDARDEYTQGHSERVAHLSCELAHILGLSVEASHEIYLAGILHAIGKIGVPDAVLLKPGKLTDEEFAIIMKHPEIGHRIVERLGHLQFVLPGVLYHHERWDGRGYPHGLQGLSIPLMARVLAVADAFDAMTSCRPYRSAMPIEKAHRIINSGAGEQWDSEIVACFNQWYEKRTSTIDLSVRPSNQGIIPQDGPMEQIAQAVMTLIH